MKDYCALTKQGKREQNEDFVYPSPLEEEIDSNLFIVCDGVGGAAKGEVASRLTCETIAKYFLNHVGSRASEKNDITAAVQHAEKAFDNYLANHSKSDGMATTFVLLHLHNDGATVAHAGDSRLYYVRKGQILFATRDHSLVNEWVASGYITREEAESHPKKNLITRAIAGSHEPTKAEVKLITQVEKGDYFLLCSDGVLEAIDNQKIQNIFEQDMDHLKTLINEIDRLCDERSLDNYSAVIVKI